MDQVLFPEIQHLMYTHMAHSYERTPLRGLGGSIFPMNDFRDNVFMEEISSFEEYATRGL